MIEVFPVSWFPTHHFSALIPEMLDVSLKLFCFMYCYICKMLKFFLDQFQLEQTRARHQLLPSILQAHSPMDGNKL